MTSYVDLHALLESRDQRPGKVFEHIIHHWHQSSLPIDATAVDGGSAGGRHTIPMARRLTEGVVHAFEPRAEGRDHLAERIERSKLTNVTVHPWALFDRSGAQPFFNVIGAPGYSGLRRRTAYPDRATGIVETVVECVTLDSVAANEIESRIQFIKLDLEGAEVAALHGARRVIDEHRPLVAFESNLGETAHAYGYGPDDFMRWADEVAMTLLTAFGHPMRRDLWNEPIQPSYYWAVPTERLDEHRRQIIDARRSALEALDLPDVTSS